MNMGKGIVVPERFIPDTAGFVIWLAIDCMACAVMPTFANDVRAMEAADVLSAMGLGGRPGEVESLPELFFYTYQTQLNPNHNSYNIYTYNLISNSLGMRKHM